jgi:hypothetical protein
MTEVFSRTGLLIESDGSAETGLNAESEAFAPTVTVDFSLLADATAGLSNSGGFGPSSFNANSDVALASDALPELQTADSFDATADLSNSGGFGPSSFNANSDVALASDALPEPQSAEVFDATADFILCSRTLPTASPPSFESVVTESLASAPIDLSADVAPEVTKEGTGDSQTGKSFPWVIVAAVAGAIVLAALVGIAVKLGCRKDIYYYSEEEEDEATLQSQALDAFLAGEKKRLEMEISRVPASNPIAEGDETIIEDNFVTSDEALEVVEADGL